MHFKGAAETQGVSRNKNVTLCLSFSSLSDRHPSVQTDPVIAVVYHAGKACAVTSRRNLLSYHLLHKVHVYLAQHVLQ